MCGWESNNLVQVYQFSNQLIKSYNNDFDFDIWNWCVRDSLCKRTTRTNRQKRNTERIRESVQTHVYRFKQYVYTDTTHSFRYTKNKMNVEHTGTFVESIVYCFLCNRSCWSSGIFPAFFRHLRFASTRIYTKRNSQEPPPAIIIIFVIGSIFFVVVVSFKTEKRMAKKNCVEEASMLNNVSSCALILADIQVQC